jgi:hypothetical protein
MAITTGTEWQYGQRPHQNAHRKGTPGAPWCGPGQVVLAGVVSAVRTGRRIVLGLFGYAEGRGLLIGVLPF